MFKSQSKILEFFISFWKIILCSLVLICCTTSCDNNYDSNEKLVVAVAGDYCPFGYVDEVGELIGFDVDLAYQIGRGLKRKVIIKHIEFKDLQNELRERKVDLAIAAISQDSSRKKYADFSIPYCSMPLVMLFKMGKHYNTLYDIPVIGVSEGTSMEKYTKKTLGKAKDTLSSIKTFNTEGAAVIALLKGEIDAIIMEQAVAADQIRKNKNKNLVLNIIDCPKGNYVIACPKNSKLLLEINKEIKNLMATGTINKLREKHGLNSKIKTYY